MSKEHWYDGWIFDRWVAPHQDPLGRRMYSEPDVDRLRCIRRAINEDKNSGFRQWLRAGTISDDQTTELDQSA